MRRALIAVAVFAAVLVLSVSGRQTTPAAVAAIAGVRTAGAWAPLVYISIYAAAVVAFVPAWLLAVTGGALFGFWPALVYVLAGAVLGSTAAFLIGRYAARGAVERRLERSPTLRSLDAAVEREGRRLVFLLRLSPVVPFNVINYVLGVTNIPLRDFLFGAPGMVPAACVYVYAGNVAGEALLVSGQATVPHDASYYTVLLVGLAATIMATAVVTRAARRAIIDVSL